MKKSHYLWTVPLTGVFLMGAGVSASAQQDKDIYLDSTNRVKLSLRFGLNIHAKFMGIGSASGNGNYFDGYVLTDSTGNFLGYTSYWGYDNASQYNLAANTFSFHNPAATGTSSESSDSDNPYPGVELAYDRQLGVKEDWHHLRYGVEGALNYMKISLNDNSFYNAAVTTETYPFGGIPGQIPSPGYQGHFNGDPHEPVLVYDGTPGPSTTGTLQTQDNFSGDLWGGRLGPYVELPFGKKEQFTLSLSGGLAVGLLDANESWQQTLSLANGGGSISGGGNNVDVLWGWYAGASANYQFSEHWGLDAGAQFEDLGKYDHSFGGREASLDLSRSLFLLIGVSCNF
jgi:hypothetical protein